MSGLWNREVVFVVLELRLNCKLQSLGLLAPWGDHRCFFIKSDSWINGEVIESISVISIVSANSLGIFFSESVTQVLMGSGSLTTDTEELLDTMMTSQTDLTSREETVSENWLEKVDCSSIVWSWLFWGLWSCWKLNEWWDINFSISLLLLLEESKDGIENTIFWGSSGFTSKNGAIDLILEFTNHSVVLKSKVVVLLSSIIVLRNCNSLAVQ